MVRFMATCIFYDLGNLINQKQRKGSNISPMLNLAYKQIVVFLQPNKNQWHPSNKSNVYLYCLKIEKI